MSSNDPKFSAKLNGDNDFRLILGFQVEFWNLKKVVFDFGLILLTKLAILFCDVLDVLEMKYHVMHIFWTVRPSSFWSTINFFKSIKKKERNCQIYESHFSEVGYFLVGFTEESGSAVQNQNKNKYLATQKLSIFSTKKYYMDQLDAAKEIIHRFDVKISVQEA